MKKRTWFKIPTKKQSIETQTVQEIEGNTILYSKMHENSLNLLMTNSFRSNIRFENVLAENIKSMVLYFLSDPANNDFDSLSIPKFCFNDLNPSVIFDFREKCLYIRNPTRNAALEIPLNLRVADILVSLSHKKVSADLRLIFESIRISEWNNGKILCKCIDNCTNIGKETLLILRICSDAFHGNDYGVLMSQCLSLYQNVCTDPSPNVCRYYSIIDWREKMWNNIEKEFPKITEKSEPLQINYNITNYDHKKTIPYDLSSRLLESLKGNPNKQ